MPTERIAVPKHLVHGSPDDNYILRVVGEAQTEYGIMDGDMLVIYRTAEANTGELIISSGSLVLYAGNVTVEGVVVGLMRKYDRKGTGTCLIP